MGTTKEIAIHPPGAKFSDGDFHWRLSNAQVNADNSFSLFKGYDRHLMVLSGNGMKLNSYTVKSFDVYSFQGEEPVFCSLINGPVEDLGIIFDRKRYHCEMAVRTVDKSQVITFPEGVHFIKSLTDAITIDGNNLRVDDVLKIEGSESVEIYASDLPRQIAVISILRNLTNFDV
jgi:environmental stress-induced protein Ves